MSSPNNSMTVPSHIEALYPNLSQGMIVMPVSNAGNLEGRQIRCYCDKPKRIMLIIGVSSLMFSGLAALRWYNCEQPFTDCNESQKELSRIWCIMCGGIGSILTIIGTVSLFIKNRDYET